MLDMKPEQNSQQRLNELMAQANKDNGENFKLGIILLSVFIVVLLIIFGVYLFRSKVPTSETSNQVNEPTKETIVDRLLGTNTNKPTNIQDADKDGLSDQDEAGVYKTNINKIDTDNDGLTDKEEVMVYKTDPNKADTDGDGISDGQEIKERHDPLDSRLNAEWPPRPTDLSSKK